MIIPGKLTDKPAWHMAGNIIDPLMLNVKSSLLFYSQQTGRECYKTGQCSLLSIDPCAHETTSPDIVIMSSIKTEEINLLRIPAEIACHYISRWHRKVNRCITYLHHCKIKRRALSMTRARSSGDIRRGCFMAATSSAASAGEISKTSSRITTVSAAWGAGAAFPLLQDLRTRIFFDIVAINTSSTGMLAQMQIKINSKLPRQIT